MKMVSDTPSSDTMENDADNDSSVIRQVSPEITTISIPFIQYGVLKTGGRATIGQYAR